VVNLDQWDSGSNLDNLVKMVTVTREWPQTSTRMGVKERDFFLQYHDRQSIWLLAPSLNWCNRALLTHGLWYVSWFLLRATFTKSIGIC
jgi:hypothetical protein